MNINYIETKSGKKLFSFYRHDFKMEENVGIDGGFDYTRLLGNPELKKDSIENLIKDIRNQFTWGQKYNKDNTPLPSTKYVLLKDLETDHIIGILKYFTERLMLDDINVKSNLDKQWVAYHLIFLEELKYKLGQQSAEDIKKQEK